MTLRKVLHYPDPGLRQKAKPVEVVDDEIRALIKDMIETMYADEGVGLAATQIGITKRIFVMDVSDTHKEPMVLINPEIIEKTGKIKGQEGCLSLPGIYADVERAEKVVVKALDQKNKEIEMEAEGLLAVCIQHECDHLEGKVFVDHLSALKRHRLLAKLRKLQKQNL